MAHKCYQYPAGALTDCVSCLLTAWRPPACGRDTANCRSCVLWRSARGFRPLFIPLERVKRDSSLPGWLTPFIRRCPVIGGPVASEYQHDKHMAGWGYEIIGCMLWLPDNFSTQVFWLFCCQVREVVLMLEAGTVPFTTTRGHWRQKNALENLFFQFFLLLLFNRIFFNFIEYMGFLIFFSNLEKCFWSPTDYDADN